MKEFTYVVKDELGLHARPAGLFVKKVASYKSTVTITAPKGVADARRLMAVMKLSVKQGDSVTVRVEGEDEESAVSEIEAFFNENF